MKYTEIRKERDAVVKQELLQKLRGYRNSMTEFEENEMDYLILLVEIDILKGKE